MHAAKVKAAAAAENARKDRFMLEPPLYCLTLTPVWRLTFSLEWSFP